MMRRFIPCVVLCAVAACSQEPVGGRGPFDPAYDPPPRVLSQQPVITEQVPGEPQAANAQDFRTQIENALDQADAQRGGAPVGQTPAPQSVASLGSEAQQPVQPSPGSVAQIDPQTGAPVPNGEIDIGIDPNDQSIDLTITPRELQKIQREEAARRREAARAQRVEIQPEALPDQDINANVVRFARQTSHPVGTRVYRRDRFRSRTQSASVCRRFDSPDEAQRQFLANGGPQSDRYNLDPDGDGFACRFNPELYRQLQF